MSVFLKIEEPDIFLVENLDDINSDALMFNTELQYVKLTAITNVVDIFWRKSRKTRFYPKLKQQNCAFKKQYEFLLV